MAERNQIKERFCGLCRQFIRGKAYTFKAHVRECKVTHEMAAKKALLDKTFAKLYEPAIGLDG